MQMGSIPALLIMQRGDVHLLPPTPAISPCSLYFLDRYQSPPIPLSPWLTSKRTPSPLKVPFSLVLMADRLWPHSLPAAACPHCVPLSAQQRVGGGQTASPNRTPDMDVWAEGGGASAPRAELSSTCNSRLPYASSVRGWARHGPRVLVPLGCLFNSWGS